MKSIFSLKLLSNFFFFVLLVGLGGCLRGDIRPMYRLNDALFQSSNSYREPSLANQWLVSLANYQGKDKIEMIKTLNRTRVSLPGLNRADSQPISVSVSANGERLALVRQRADKTELLIYRRKLGTLQRIELTPKGIPRRVSLDSTGRVLAVQVSRQGRWDIEVIRLKS